MRAMPQRKGCRTGTLSSGLDPRDNPRLNLGSRSKCYPMAQRLMCWKLQLVSIDRFEFAIYTAGSTHSTAAESRSELFSRSSHVYPMSRLEGLGPEFQAYGEG